MQSQVARALGVDRTTVGYHARVLARADLLVVHRVERGTILALPGDPAPARALAPCAADRVLHALRAAGGEAAADALACGLPARTLRRALRVLQGAGLVERIECAGASRVRLSGADPDARRTAAPRQAMWEVGRRSFVESL